MSLENIKQELEQKAAATEKEILDEAKQKIADIKAKAQASIKELEADAKKKQEAEAQNLENRESSLTHMESQKLVFEARKQELAAVYGEAEEKIKNMSGKDREPIVKAMLAKANKEIDVSTVYANKTDASFVEGADVKDMDTGGCIICENKEGTVRVDLTFPTLFEDVKEKTLPDVSKKLFG